MLVSGDEIGRTQKGNNNAYCQDNEVSWLDWAKADTELLKFTKKLIKIRKEHPSFCRRRWFKGRPIKGVGVEDIVWFQPQGEEMSEENWSHDFAKSLGIYLNGRGLLAVGSKGETIIDDSFYVIFNAHHEPLDFKLPSNLYAKDWTTLIDTQSYFCEEATYQAEDTVRVDGRSVVLLQHKILKDDGSKTL